MAIFYYSEDIPLPCFKKRFLNKWIKEIAANYNKVIGTITYMFCTDGKILEINNQYLQHDYYTDIITFVYTDGNEISGDLVISLDTVKTNAEKFGVDYMNELYRVIIHGILHLCGINDKTSNEQATMTGAENSALVELRKMLSDK